MVNDHAQRLADAAVPFSWAAWILSHLKDLNVVLQTIALLAAIVASVTAAIYHSKKNKEMGKGK